MLSMYKRQSSYQTHEQLSKTLVSGLHHNFAKVEKDIPLHFASGKGSTLIDFDGNEYLDLFARCGAMFLGHGNEEYCNTLKDAIMAPITEYSSYDEEVCQWFKKYVPCCEQIRFGLSGTEMVLNALRLARAYTGRRRIIRFNGHYHGSADNIMGGKAKGALYPIVIEDEGSVFTTKGRASGVLQDQMLLIPWNHIETFRKTIQAYGADVAAVIMEPVMINGGSIFPLPGYLEEVRDICNQHGILLIFDEIITGVHMGLGGAQAITGVTPDLCLMGKAVSGGAVPVTALMGKADIMGLYRDGNVVHGGTFNGYHLGMAAIATTFRILSRNEKKIYKHISQINKQISEIIQKEANRCELQVIVQGPPACAAFHCTDKEITCYEEITQNILEKDMIIRSCMEQYGILVYRTSRMYLNIAIEEKDIDFLQLHIRPAMEMAEKIIKRLKI